jgi:hypothetical protein
VPQKEGNAIEDYEDKFTRDGGTSTLHRQANMPKPLHIGGSGERRGGTKRATPLELLDETGNYQGSPRSPSRNGSILGSGTTTLYEQGIAVESPSPRSDTTPRQSRDGSEGDEDEEYDKEQIASAVYFPHRRPASDDQARLFDQGHPADFQYGLAQDQHDVLSQAVKRLSASGVGSVGHVDISLLSQDEKSIFHRDLESSEGQLGDNDDHILSKMSELSICSASESGLDSADESGLSAQEEESSLTDDPGITLTSSASPTMACRRKRSYGGTLAPVGAVELKPYRHQVGGHTTVFRFSRRAVCKQLDNRENQFYERIELRHPEMLMFLARFVFERLFVLISHCVDCVAEISAKTHPFHFGMPCES